MTKNFQVGDCDCSPLFRGGLPGPKSRPCSPKVKIYYITDVKSYQMGRHSSPL